MGDCADAGVGCVEVPGPEVEARDGAAGRGEEVRYFPGIPEGFPNEGDLRVARALAKMSWMLHRWAPRSSLWPGHEERMEAHRRRVWKRLRRRQGAWRGLRSMGNSQ